jgi:2-polyprenyl-3-methyl-5-hydroxy-6-metoxy-1,4-benzoquinol methylase
MSLDKYNSFLLRDKDNAIFRGKKAMAQFKSLRWPTRLLDVGCGSGELLRIASEQGIKKLYGIDGVEDALQNCERINAETRKVDLNLSGIPFENEKFDGVTCLEVLEHLYAPQEIINEIFRVLQRGSWAIISVPNPYKYSIRLKILFGGTVSDPTTIGGHIKFFRSKDLREILTGSGFSQIRIEGVAYPTAYRKYGRFTNLFVTLMPNIFATWLFVYCQKPQ